MKQICWRPAARADLIEIWIWTVEKWGAAKADEYLAGIELAANILCTHSAIGVDAGDIARGLRRHIVGHHHFYYFVSQDRLDFVRVLHERMRTDLHMFDE